MTKINETLLEKLIVNPQPQPSKKEVKRIYCALFERMYPCKESFVDFLSAQSIDRQYESAQVIVQRLCYCANFPPSYYALTDVIAVENYQENNIRETDMHIPRDHFIHLVYLYLLGIYIFFYNSEFYNAIVALNRFERRDVTAGQPTIGAVKDFISEWKYFCIYHDVGYPGEILGNNKQYKQRCREKTKIVKELSKTQTEFRASLEDGKLLRQQSLFCSIEIISKLLFAKMVIDNSRERVDSNHKFFSAFKNKDLKSDYENAITLSFADINENLYSGMVLEKIYSSKCLKTIAPVVGLKRISVIGIEKESGKVCFLSFNYKNEWRFVYVEDIESNIEFKSILKTPGVMFFDDFVSEYFDFFFVLRAEKDAIAFSTLVEQGMFQTVYALIKAEFENDFLAVSKETQFLDVPFKIYQWLLGKIRKDFEGKELSKFVEEQFEKIKSESIRADDLLLARYKCSEKIQSAIFSDSYKYEQLIIKENQKLFNEYVKDAIKEIKCCHNIDELIKETVKQYGRAVSAVVNNKSTMPCLVRELKQTVIGEIEGDMTVLQLFTQMYLFSLTIMDPDKPLASFNYVSNTFDFPDFLIEKIERKVQNKIGYKDLSELKDSYLLKHGITVDHGMLSACYAAAVFSCYRIAIEKSTDSKTNRLLSILFDIPDDLSVSKVRYVDNYEHIFENVLYAIFVHNLYPDHFRDGSKGKEYRIHISDPFTYLSLLCDALQTWNRPKSLRKSMLGYKVIAGASECFNIEVTEDKIVISDCGNERLWTSKFIASMREYISNVDAFVAEA